MLQQAITQKGTVMRKFFIISFIIISAFTYMQIYKNNHSLKSNVKAITQSEGNPN